MNEHAGPACALSFLIVGVFAVLLHDNRPPTGPSYPTGRIVQDVAPEGTPSLANRDGPEPGEADDQARPIENSSAESPRPVPKDVVPSQLDQESVEATGPTSETQTQPASRSADQASAQPGPLKKPALSPSRTSFAVVQAGEKLRDVATRVYGSADATEELWRANRDRVSMVDSPLPPGTLLRTP
jgi:hypothetical protein